MATGHWDKAEDDEHEADEEENIKLKIVKKRKQNRRQHKCCGSCMRKLKHQILNIYIHGYIYILYIHIYKVFIYMM